MPDIYKTYPKGFMAVNHTIDPALIGGDYVIGWCGWGLTRSNNFTNLIDAAAKANKPFGAFYEIDPQDFVEQYNTLNLTKWLEHPEDNWVVKQVLSRVIMSGEAKRTIHFFVVGMNRDKDPLGNTFPDAWRIACAQFVASALWTLYQIPSFLYIDPSKSAALPHGDKDNWTTFLGNMAKALPDDIDYTGIVRGIGTYLDAFPFAGKNADWDAIPYPPDSYADDLSKQVRETGLGNAPRRHLVCYSTGDFIFPGVTGGTVLLFMYLGNLAQFYKEINFTPVNTDPIPDPTPDPTPDPIPEPEPTPDYSEIKPILVSIDQSLKTLIAMLGEAQNNPKVIVNIPTQKSDTIRDILRSL